MDVITEDTLKDLLSNTDNTCLSIYLATDSVAIRSDRVDNQRFRQLLDEALKSVSDSRVAAALRQKGSSLIDDMEFWKHQGHGLAVFISESRFSFFRLPIPVKDSYKTDSRFYVTPLIGLLGNVSFHVLALSQGSVRLLLADRHGATPHTVKGMPANLDSALWYKDHDKLLQMRNSAGPAGNFHGEGDDSRTPHSDLREYLLKIDAAICTHFKSHATPLVVVALQPTLGMFNKLTKYGGEIVQVEHDSSKLTPQQLHELSLPLMMELMDAPKGAAINDFGMLSANSPQRVAATPSDVLAAAAAGRIDTLMVSAHTTSQETAAFHESIPGQTPDLLSAEIEEAVQQTLKNSGQVLLVERDEIGGDNLRAILRY